MKKILVICLTLASNFLIAQSGEDEIYDTARRIDPTHTSRQQFFRDFVFKNHQDSSMLFFSQYDKIKRNNIGIQNLGDIATPFIQLYFNPFTKTGFYSGLNPYGKLYYTSEDALAYDARLPYTEFRFSQGRSGQRGLIQFEALHTQNLGENFNFSIQYHSVSYDGFYKNQSLSNKNASANAHYRSKDRKYLAFLSINWNKANRLENGGIDRSPETDTLFRSLGPNVRFVDVLLNNSRSINRLSEQSLKQSYKLISGKDSSSGLFIAHEFTMLRQSNYYTAQSNDIGFYDSIYYFNSNTTDSIAFRSYTNALEIYTPINDKRIGFLAGIKYDNFVQYFEANDANYKRLKNHNSSLYSQFNFSLFQKFHSTAFGSLVFEGLNQGDYLMEWRNRTNLSEKHGIDFNADISLSSRKPLGIQNRLFSNHYIYENNFSPTSTKSIRVGFEKKTNRYRSKDAYSYTLPTWQYGFNLRYHLIDNFIYFGKDALPAQGAKGQNALQTDIFANIKIMKFRLHQEFAWQTFSNNLGESLQLPNLISKSSLYFQTYAFKKATFLQIGVDAWVCSDYQARVYNPATLQFQQSDYRVGGYPFFDVFIHAEVKTARVFFRMEHVNEGLPNDRYFKNYLYTTPFYPASPRRFRIGFVWKFYY